MESAAKVQDESVTELADRLAGARSARDEISAELDRLADRRPALLVDGTDDELTRHDTAMAAVRRRLEQANARVDDLARKIEMAETSDAERARRVRRSQAIAARDQMREELGREYPRWAAEGIDRLSRSKAVDDLIREVNLDLPAGAEPIEHVEVSLRHAQATPDRRTTVRVKRGVRKHPQDAHSPGGPDAYEMREVEEEVVEWGAPAHRPVPLYHAVELPGLRPGEPNYRVPGTQRPY